MTTALAIALRAHRGQYRRDGVTPYMHHVFAVSSKFPTESFEYQIALLHDVVEDSDYTLENLLEAGIDSLVVEAVDAITKRKGESYGQYLERVSQNENATRVKLVDIAANLADDPTTSQVQKYAKAIRFLALNIDFG